MVLKLKITNLLQNYLNEYFKAEESQETAYWKEKFVTYLEEVELIAPGPSTFDPKELRDPIRNWIAIALKSKSLFGSKEEKKESDETNEISQSSKQITKKSKSNKKEKKKEVNKDKAPPVGKKKTNITVTGSDNQFTTPGKESTTTCKEPTTPGKALTIPGKEATTTDNKVTTPGKVVTILGKSDDQNNNPSIAESEDSEMRELKENFTGHISPQARKLYGLDKGKEKDLTINTMVEQKSEENK